MSDGVEYTVVYESNINVGTASIVVEGKEPYATGVVRESFNIKKAIPSYRLPDVIDAEYGQSLAGVTLPDGFSWQDSSASVGEPGERQFFATYTPVDVGNYEIVKDVPITIRVTRRIDNSFFAIDIADCVYSGFPYQPQVTSSVVPKNSYSIEYYDNISAGEATVVVSGKGFYVGSCSLSFSIAKAVPDYQNPGPVSVDYGQLLSNALLPKGFVWQSDNMVVDWSGARTVYADFVPEDQRNYEIIHDIPIKIVAPCFEFNEENVRLDQISLEYTGKKIEPNFEVLIDGAPLTEGRDYSAEYRDNIAPGNALLVIKGEGRFSRCGTTVCFDIVRSSGNYIALPGHWATGSGGWWYPYDNGGYPANEWCIIDDSYYHFNGSGYMQTGWLNLGGTWYYLSGSGIMQTGWQKIGGSWYWFDDSGAMASGWKQIGGTYYYFNGSGAMQTGWLSTGGAWYWLGGSGAMQTGWQAIGGVKYFFDDSGAMASGWKQIDGSYYYFSGSGAMQTGWLNAGGAWYCLSDSGVMQTGWQVIDGAKYHFDGSGAMASGWSVIDGSYYYFDGSGVMQTNKRIDGSYVDSDGRWDQNA